MPLYIDPGVEKFFVESKQLEKEYLEACEWISSFGIDYRITRFGNYEKDVEEFIKGNRNVSAKENVKTFMNARLEASELIRIKKTFESFESSQLIDSIKKLTSGQRFRIDNKADQSRDFAFELNIASRFYRAGFVVNLKSVSDLIAIIDNRKLYVECKRLKSYNQLEKRVKAANRQISRRLSSDISPKSRGMIAINLTDIINPDAMPTVSYTLEEQRAVSAKTLRDFVLSNKGILSKKRDKKCLGVLTEFSTQGFINAEKIENAAFLHIREGNILHYPMKPSDLEFINSFWPKLGNQHILQT